MSAAQFLHLQTQLYGIAHGVQPQPLHVLALDIWLPLPLMFPHEQQQRLASTGHTLHC